MYAYTDQYPKRQTKQNVLIYLVYFLAQCSSHLDIRTVYRVMHNLMFSFVYGRPIKCKLACCIDKIKKSTYTMHKGVNPIVIYKYFNYNSHIHTGFWCCIMR